MESPDRVSSLRKAASAAAKRFLKIIHLRGAPVTLELRSIVKAEKAVTAAVKHYYRMIDPCGTAESLGLKASIMAQKLIKNGVIAATNKTRADRIINQALMDHRKMVETKTAAASMESQVAQALMAAGLVVV